MSKLRLGVMAWLSPVFSAAIGLAAIYIIINLHGDYGLLAFCTVPVALAVICCGFMRLEGPKSIPECTVMSVLALFLVAVGLFAFPIEGVICILLAAPIAMFPLIVGITIGYFLFHHRSYMRSISSLVLLAAIFAWSALDYKAPGSISEVSTSIEIAGTPRQVWNAVLNLGELPEPRDWLLRSGMACPVSTELEGSGVGATRTCMLSTGPMPERITAWEPARKLGFVAMATPPPLREINPFYDIKPPHQHGYYEVLYGEFRIEPLPNGRSRLTRITKYINRIRPSFYWNWWSNLAADHAHRYVLESVRDNVERPGYNARHITQ